MKNLKSLMAALALMMGAMTMVSCLSDGESTSTYDGGALATVREYMGTVYLYGDDGVTYYTTNSDFIRITSNTNQTSYPERVEVYFKYVDSNESAASTTRQITIVAARQVLTKPLCNMPDTIQTRVPLRELTYAYSANGYITAFFSFYYENGGYGFDLYPESSKDDEVTMRLVQSYGKEQTYGQNYSIYHSFRQPSFEELQEQLEEQGLQPLVPVQDSVYVKVVGWGMNGDALEPMDKNYSRFRISAY